MANHEIPEEYKRHIIESFTDKIVEFDHPTAGRVKGHCLGCKFEGFNKDGIPDFSLHLKGKTGREVWGISIPDNYAKVCEFGWNDRAKRFPNAPK